MVMYHVLAFGQASLTSAVSELQTVKDSQMHQKKRINEMLVSLLKDLNEVGTIIGTSNDAMKVKHPNTVLVTLRKLCKVENIG